MAQYSRLDNTQAPKPRQASVKDSGGSTVQGKDGGCGDGSQILEKPGLEARAGREDR